MVDECEPVDEPRPQDLSIDQGDESANSGDSETPPNERESRSLGALSPVEHSCMESMNHLQGRENLKPNAARSQEVQKKPKSRHVSYAQDSKLSTVKGSSNIPVRSKLQRSVFNGQSLDSHCLLQQKSPAKIPQPGTVTVALSTTPKRHSGLSNRVTHSGVKKKVPNLYHKQQNKQKSLTLHSQVKARELSSSRMREGSKGIPCAKSGSLGEEEVVDHGYQSQQSTASSASLASLDNSSEWKTMYELSCYTQSEHSDKQIQQLISKFFNSSEDIIMNGIEPGKCYKVCLQLNYK